MAGGLAYQALFAVFAALWVGFATAGLLLRSNEELQQAFFSMISNSVPGLIDTGDGNGAIDPAELLKAPILGWTGAIALVGLLFTALGWLASCRDAVRTLFGLPGELLNPIVLKLKDIGLGLAFGAALLISSALLVFSTQAISVVLGWLGVDQHSPVGSFIGTTVGLLLMFVLDTTILAGLFRALSGLTIPLRRLLVGAALGGAGLGVLKILGSALLGGASKNPLLASFAVIIGLLIWFNLICQVILIAASWISVGMSDVGLIADPKVARARHEEQLAEAAREAATRAEAERRLDALKKKERRGWARRLVGGRR